MKKALCIIASCLLIQACTAVENYMLGKDNTPEPSPLKAIEPKIDLVNVKSVPIGSKQNKSDFAKLSPVISDQVIYTASANGEIKDIRQGSNESLWTQKIHQSILSGPSVADAVIAVSTGDSAIVLLNKKDGSILWKKSVSSQVLSKPAIAGQTLVAKTIDGQLYAFDLKGGAIRWQVQHGAPDFILKGSSSPVIQGNQVFAAYSDGKFEAVDLNNGHVLWQRAISYPKGSSDVERLVDVDADPIIKNDVAYLASYQGQLEALSLKTGQVLWSVPASVYKNISYYQNAIYMTDTDDVVWAVDAQNGKIKWQQKGLKARGVTEPVVANHQLYVGDRYGYMHALSTQDGHFIARAQLPAAIKHPAVIDQKDLYVQSGNGMLNQFAIG